MLNKYKKYDPEFVNSGMMGPNALMLTEELTQHMMLREGMMILDLGCGKALSSVFLSKEFGVTVYAVDPQVHSSENFLMLDKLGLQNSVFPINGDASLLPFQKEVFDAVICVNAYHNFGTDAEYFSNKLVPLMKKDAQFGLAIPCLRRAYYDAQEEERKAFFDSCAMPAFITADIWKRLVESSNNAEVEYCGEMECTAAAWSDWIKVGNPLARDDSTLCTQIDSKVAFVAIVGRRK